MRKGLENIVFQGSFGNECAVSSVVEHFLDTEGVTGSNPVSRTSLRSKRNAVKAGYLLRQFF